MGFMSRFKGEASVKDASLSVRGEGEGGAETGPPTFRAIWNGTVIAESNETIEIEGNQYFPAGAVNNEYLVEVAQTTVCSWKGTASYYDVVAFGEVASEAAWYYPNPKDAVPGIQNRVAFWRGVKVEEV